MAASDVRIAAVDGALVVVVAVDGRMSAQAGRDVAVVVGAEARIVAVLRGVHAPEDGIAGIDGAEVPVVAGLVGVDAAGAGLAGVHRAGVPIVAGLVGHHAADIRAALAGHAVVGLPASNIRIDAPEDGIADVFGAEGMVVAVVGLMVALPGVFVVPIPGADVMVIAIDRRSMVVMLVREELRLVVVIVIGGKAVVVTVMSFVGFEVIGVFASFFVVTVSSVGFEVI